MPLLQKIPHVDFEEVINKIPRVDFVCAQVAELVDALASGASAARRGGSSPFLGTIRFSW